MDGKKNEVDIQLDDKIADGVYSNLVVINHSRTDFVLDFVSVLPGLPKPRVRSRVIMTPEHAKNFKKALEDNIYNFEKSNGKIPDTENNREETSLPLNFGDTTYEA